MRSTLLAVGLVIVAGISGASVAVAEQGPLVDAGLDQTVEQGSVVLLDGTGTRAPEGAIEAYEWTIIGPGGNDVTPENRSNPETQFRAVEPGRYEVTLQVTDEDDRTGSDTLYVTVEPREPPKVSIDGPDRVTANETATYTAEATAPAGEIRRIEWDSGDVGVVSTRRVDHPPGTMTVSVTVTDEHGESATARKDVTVREPDRDPVAHIDGPSTVTRGSTASFNVRAQAPDGSIEQIEWGSGQTGSTATRTFRQPAGTVVPIQATVTDDDGDAATATHRVQVTEPADAGGSPAIEVDGPREVRTSSTHEYHAETSHPDGDEVTVRWFGETFVDSGPTHEHEFGEPDGSTVQFTAVATDSDGDTASKTVEVDVVAPPQVSINGLPEDCIQAGQELTLRADTDDPTSDLNHEWRVDGDVVETGETLTHEFTRDGTTSVTLSVTDGDGYTGTTTADICVTTEHEPPEIQSLSAVWFASTHEQPGAPPVEHDAFDTRVDSRFAMVEFTAAATSPSGSDLTYRWDFGDGATGVTSTSGDGGETTISHDYSPPHGQEREATEYTVTLVVEDEHGATATETRTVAVRNILGGTGSYDLSADSHTVEVGEEVTFTVENELLAARHVEGDLVFGDGYDRRIASETDTAKRSTTYDHPGTYTVQFWSGNEDTGLVGLDDQIEITVVDESYTLYTYGVEERQTRVSSESPGEEWERGSVSHTERTLVEVRNQTVPAHSSEARHLEWDGYHAVDQHTERVQVDTETTRAVDSPGEEWSLVERDVDTIQQRDGWEYQRFNSRQHGSEWSLVRAVRTAEEIHQTTTSVDRPRGSGWSRSHSVDRTRTGWDYGWVSSRSAAPSGSSIVDTRRVLVDVERETVCVNREYTRDYYGRIQYRCTQTERQIVDRTYDTRYQYRAPDYSTVWEWERTTTVYDREYEYRKPNYETVSRNRYERPVYEQRSYVEYQKEFHTMTPHYEWSTTTITEHRALEYPTDQNVEWVETEERSCSDENPLSRRACS